MEMVHHPHYPLRGSGASSMGGVRVPSVCLADRVTRKVLAPGVAVQEGGQGRMGGAAGEAHHLCAPQMMGFARLYPSYACYPSYLCCCSCRRFTRCGSGWRWCLRRSGGVTGLRAWGGGRADCLFMDWCVFCFMG